MSAYLSNEQIEHFKSEGYLLIPGVFPINDILYARQIFLQAFSQQLWLKAPYSSSSIINDIYNYHPELLQKLITPSFINIIKDILGDNAVWIPECSIHRNRYIHWHKDTSIQELSGETSHHNIQHSLIQAAIYFQNNDESGGGITVISRSHIQRDHYYQMLSSSLPKRVYYKLLKMLKISAFDRMERSPLKTDIPSCTGDLVLFDVRLDHRATLPQAEYINNHTDKLAIFNTFGKDNIVTRKYFQFMKARKEPYYCYFREYPLPKEVYQWAEELNINVMY